MKRIDFTYPSYNGENQVAAYRWLPDATPRGIIQIAHGMAEHALRYERFAYFMTEHGFIVTGEDHLGHGRTAPTLNDLGYWGPGDNRENVTRDMHQLLQDTKAHFPKLPYIMLGHSMGSMLLRCFLIDYGDQVDAAIVCGTGDVSVQTARFGTRLSSVVRRRHGEHHRSEFLASLVNGSNLKRIPDAETPFDWLSFSRANINRFVDDPLCGVPFTVNGHLALFAITEYMNREINHPGRRPQDLPLFFIAGAEDPIGHYGKDPEAIAARYQKSGASRVQTRIYPEMRHEILNEKKGRRVMQDILDWLEQEVPAVPAETDAERPAVALRKKQTEPIQD